MRKMKWITRALVGCILLAGCASRPDTASPDYANYLQALDSIAAYEAQADRTIFTLEVGDEAVTLPAGAKMIVRAPAPALPTPQMWRDHAYEAQLAYYGTIWSIVGGVAIPAAAQAYGSYNSRKMIENIMRYSSSPTWNNHGDGTQTFTGGWGDRSNVGTGDFSETSTVQPYEVEPVIVEPKVVVVP